MASGDFIPAGSVKHNAQRWQCAYGEREVICLVHCGCIEIDEDGHIWRLAYRRSNGRGLPKLVPCPRVRMEKADERGYLHVSAKIDGRQRAVRAHRLVWQYFFGDIPNGYEINHINGEKSDNRPSNLEAVTRQENCRHAVKTGLFRSGCNAVSAKLTRDQIILIRSEYASGKVTQYQLAAQFDVDVTTIGAVVRGEHADAKGGPIIIDRPAGLRLRDPKGRMIKMPAPPCADAGRETESEEGEAQ